MANNNLILKEKVMDMLDYMRDRLKNFPRDERSGITPRIRATGYEMLEIASDIGNGFYNATNLKAFDRKKNALEAYINYALRCQYHGLLEHCSGEGLKRWIEDNITFTHEEQAESWDGVYEQIAA